MGLCGVLGVVAAPAARGLECRPARRWRKVTQEWMMREIKKKRLNCQLHALVHTSSGTTYKFKAPKPAAAPRMAPYVKAVPLRSLFSMPRL